MKFKELVTLDIKNLEVYILEDIPGKLVINNHGNGLFVITDTLETYLQKIVFLEGVKIARIYKKLDETELLLYCPANLCVVHVNMRTYEHTVIKLDESFKYINFLPLYFWAHHDLLLTTSDQFFRIDLDKRNIIQISQAVESTASSHYLFYECWKKYHTANIINFYLKEMIIAVEENNQINIDFFDPKHHQHKKPMTYPDVDVQEVIYNNGTLLFIKNNAIEIITTEGKKGKLGIEKPYKFCTARFVKNSRYKFVALYCDTSAAKHDQLRLFEIEHKDSKIID